MYAIINKIYNSIDNIYNEITLTKFEVYSLTHLIKGLILLVNFFVTSVTFHYYVDNYFCGKNYIMKVSILLIVSIITFGILNSCSSNLNNDSGSNEPKIINKEKFDQLVKDSNTRIMDVRTPGEVSEGYIAGAVIFNDINDSNFDANLDKLDKSKNYIVYCKSGGRSSRAVEIMREKGFKKVYDLEGGVSNWTGGLKH